MNRVIRSLFILIGCWLFLATSSLNNAFAQNERPNDAISMIWSPDGQLIATGYEDGIITISDGLSGDTLQIFIAHTNVVIDVAWSPDSHQLASVSMDKTLRLWDVLQGTLSKIVSMTPDYASTVIWSPDGKRIITGGIEDSHNLKVWDAKAGTLLQEFKAGSSVQMKWSPNGEIIALANPTGIIELRDGKTLEVIKFMDDPELGGQGYDNYQLAWKADSTQITAGKLNGMLRTWDISTGKILSTFATDDSNPLDFKTTLIMAISTINNDTKLVSVSADGRLRTWDVASSRIEQTVQLTDAAYAAAFSPDTSKIAFASTDRVIHIVSFPIS